MPITTPETFLPKYGGDDEHFPHVLTHLFAPVITACGYEVIPPKAKGTDVIHANIIQNIERADMLLCDMSTLNANVFFELGVRTALNKPICLVRDDLTQFVPFDLGVINHHTYSSALNVWELDREREALAKHFKESQRSEVNALWKYFSISSTGAAVSVSKSDKTDFIIKQMESLREDVRRLGTERRSGFDISPPLRAGSRGAKFAQEISFARAARGLTMQDLARAAGTSQDTIMSLERGRRVRRSAAVRVCHTLGLDPDLVWWKEPPPLDLAALGLPASQPEKEGPTDQ